MFTSGYVNTETILHFFYKVTNERGTKTVFTYAHVKWFYGQSERAYYLNYFIKIYGSFLVQVGINLDLMAAYKGHHYARANNQFCG